MSPQPSVVHVGVSKLGEPRSCCPGAIAVVHLQEAFTDPGVGASGDGALDLRVVGQVAHGDDSTRHRLQSHMNQKRATHGRLSSSDDTDPSDALEQWLQRHGHHLQQSTERAQADVDGIKLRFQSRPNSSGAGERVVGVEPSDLQPTSLPVPPPAIPLASPPAARSDMPRPVLQSPTGHAGVRLWTSEIVWSCKKSSSSRDKRCDIPFARK